MESIEDFISPGSKNKTVLNKTAKLSVPYILFSYIQKQILGVCY